MKKFTLLERMLIRHSYKPSILLDWGGLILFWNLLANHYLLIAIGTLIACFIIGTLITWKQDLNKLEATPMARAYLMLASKPFIVICLVIGLATYSYGEWLDNYIVMSIGGLFVLVYMIGLSKISKKRKEPRM